MLTAFTAGLLLITVSELGDKTFFIAMCLAMRHSRRYVFAGAVLALAAMTLLSVLLGNFAALLPKQFIYWGTIVLFVGFGFKMLYDASKMRVECREKSLVASVDCASEAEREALEAVSQAEANLRKKTPFAITLEAFTLTFIAEWGDRTQINTMVLAASNNAIGVTIGSILGHAICCAIAVFGGRLIASHISERTVTLVGGILFFVFALVTWLEGL
ncbi:TMEM165/GDT1 family protein [Leptolyngbya sp. FACHB-17]|uniref:TMEM165/GDT1 family protein n=1 Tax=unclassified Leptolyngbya TaxID=2650499 RepID=UPI001680B8DE|nr:TMEM165/GDT1 family protein [Leptolyngbya sp. FACHB-17]MBD2079007.1 TMEM165/GDT1 family protein [Leptolyngbya sp. FACHB-17]